MPGITIELTNRCNLRCLHCFEARHNADGDLETNIVEAILRSAGKNGFDHLSFTGGEPTLHPEFTAIIEMVYEAGYRFGIVSNGWNFTRVYDMLLPYLSRLSGMTFSLDGAKEETHDSLRGNGSYRRLMQAVSICVMKDIPFTLNTVITSGNRDELQDISELASGLGSRGLRFGHLLSNSSVPARDFCLSPEEKKELDADLAKLRNDASIPVFIAPGHYTHELFPCAPLQLKECNIDWRGNVTLCCHLSGHGNNAGQGDVIGNLTDITFPEACEMLREATSRFRRDKVARHSQKKFADADYFPCWYCEYYFGKVDWMRDIPENPRSAPDADDRQIHLK